MRGIMQSATMQPRMKNPAMVLPHAMKAIQNLHKATSKGGVSL